MMKRVAAIAAVAMIAASCGRSPVTPTAPTSGPQAATPPPSSPATSAALAMVVSGPAGPVGVGVAFAVSYRVNDASMLQRLRADWSGAITETAPAPPSGTLMITSMIPGPHLLTITATTANGTALDSAISVAVAP